MSKIQFVSRVPGLADIEWARPKPAKSFVPSWFKSMPASVQTYDGIINTARSCPALPDYFSQGYIMPMWMDSELTYDQETQNFTTSSSKLFPEWTFHPHSQFLDHVDSSSFGIKTDIVFKARCPWFAITEPGWSVLQLPIFYNFNKNWTVLPGVVDTDIHHELNQQVLFHSNNEKITINAGEAFVLYVPFKRQKTKYEVRDNTEKDIKLFQSQSLEINAKNIPNGVYKKRQRDRDKSQPGLFDNIKNLFLR